MDTDLALVLGLFLAGVSVPSIVSAFSDGRTPRTAAIALILGGTLVVYALSQKPGGYRLDDIPKAFVRVIADIF
ncbi:MAG: hypothetical protein ACNA7Q_10570 [Rhodobacterales bacterium]